MQGIAHEDKDFEFFPKYQGKPFDGSKQGGNIF